MDMTNLQSKSYILIDHLVSKGYNPATIRAVKRCIKLALELGSNEEIRCYYDIFEASVKKLQFQSSEVRFRLLKSFFGMVEDFDLNGGFPNHHAKGFNRPKGKVEKLNCHFKELALEHLVNGVNGKNRIKREKTVRNEYHTAVRFLLHLQDRGVKSLRDVKEMDIYSFFFDGDKKIRGVDYCRMVKAFLSHVAIEDKELIQRIIEFLPKISRDGRLYTGLTKEEGNRILLALEDMNNGLSLRDRAIGLILYFYGLRGTDISKLTFDDIDWRNNQIVIIQSKTSQPLPLPLEPIVGNAIFNYLKEIRMDQTDTTKIIFLKNDGSEPPASLTHSVYNVFKAAGVRQEEGTKGFRPMRHYFATSLLAAGEKCEVIAKLMGHRDVNTLDKYADTNYMELKKCSLSISMFPVHPDVFKL